MIARGPAARSRVHRLTRGRLLALLAIALAVLALVALLALVIGPHAIPPSDIVAALAGNGTAATRTILFDLRLPRIVLAAGAGAALGFTGALFQALLRNPLAEPYILGISNGCVVGAILGIVLGVSPFMQPVMAFAGGAMAVAAVLAIGRDAYGLRSESMLLGGTMVAAIGAAAIFMLLHLAGPQIRSAVQWMLGDLSSTQAGAGYGAAALFAAVGIASLMSGGTLNAIAQGDDEAASLGLNVTRVRTLAYVAGSLIVGVTVAMCGAVGFVGLVVPHIIRRTFGPDHRLLLPFAVVFGAVFLVICDTIARSVLPVVEASGTELPVGAITALVGAPLFITLLRKGAAES